MAQKYNLVPTINFVDDEEPEEVFMTGLVVDKKKDAIKANNYNIQSANKRTQNEHLKGFVNKEHEKTANCIRLLLNSVKTKPNVQTVENIKQNSNSLYQSLWNRNTKTCAQKDNSRMRENEAKERAKMPTLEDVFTRENKAKMINLAVQKGNNVSTRAKEKVCNTMVKQNLRDIFTTKNKAKVINPFILKGHNACTGAKGTVKVITSDVQKVNDISTKEVEDKKINLGIQKQKDAFTISKERANTITMLLEKFGNLPITEEKAKLVNLYIQKEIVGMITLDKQKQHNKSTKETKSKIINPIVKKDEDEAKKISDIEADKLKLVETGLVPPGTEMNVDPKEVKSIMKLHFYLTKKRLGNSDLRKMSPTESGSKSIKRKRSHSRNRSQNFSKNRSRHRSRYRSPSYTRNDRTQSRNRSLSHPRNRSRSSRNRSRSRTRNKSWSRSMSISRSRSRNRSRRRRNSSQSSSRSETHSQSRSRSQSCSGNKKLPLRSLSCRSRTNDEQKDLLDEIKIDILREISCKLTDSSRDQMFPFAAHAKMPLMSDSGGSLSSQSIFVNTNSSEAVTSLMDLLESTISQSFNRGKLKLKTYMQQGVHCKTTTIDCGTQITIEDINRFGIKTSGIGIIKVKPLASLVSAQSALKSNPFQREERFLTTHMKTLPLSRPRPPRVPPIIKKYVHPPTPPPLPSRPPPLPTLVIKKDVHPPTPPPFRPPPPLTSVIKKDVHPPTSPELRKSVNAETMGQQEIEEILMRQNQIAKKNLRILQCSLPDKYLQMLDILPKNDLQEEIQISKPIVEMPEHLLPQKNLQQHPENLQVQHHQLPDHDLQVKQNSPPETNLPMQDLLSSENVVSHFSEKNVEEKLVSCFPEKNVEVQPQSLPEENLKMEQSNVVLEENVQQTSDRSTFRKRKRDNVLVQVGPKCAVRLKRFIAEDLNLNCGLPPKAIRPFIELIQLTCIKSADLKIHPAPDASNPQLPEDIATSSLES